MLTIDVENDTVNLRGVSEERKSKEKQTFLSVADEEPFLFSGDDIPYADSTIVAARNEGSTSSGQSSYSMVMAWEVEAMVRVVLAVLQREVSVVDKGWSIKHTRSPSSVPKNLNSGSVGLGNFQTLREWSLLPVTMRGRLGHLS